MLDVNLEEGDVIRGYVKTGWARTRESTYSRVELPAFFLGAGIPQSKSPPALRPAGGTPD